MLLLGKPFSCFYRVVLKIEGCCPTQQPFLCRLVVNLFAFDYLTEPVIPSANCFCNTKKMIMVGIEQNRTPIISIP